MATSKRPKTQYLVALLALVVILAGLTYRVWLQPKPSAPADETYLPKAAEGKETRPSASPSAGAIGTPTAIPTNSTPQSSMNGSITISAPTQGSTVTSGSVVSGTARTASDRLYYRLKGGKSGQLALGSINFKGNTATDTPFSFELVFTNQVNNGSDQGVVEMFTLGADGSEQSIANVTVNISSS